MSSCVVAVPQVQKNYGPRSDSGKTARFLALGILSLTCGSAPIAWAQEQSGHVHITQPRAGLSAFDEVHIQQETGRLNAPKAPITIGTGATKSAPEGSTSSPVPAGATSPNTCDPKNASSPACYTATQQSRGR